MTELAVAADVSARAKAVLEGILPICSFCKRIHQPDGTWQPLESYISARSGVRFSHGLCEDCRHEHYPGYSD